MLADKVMPWTRALHWSDRIYRFKNGKFNRLDSFNAPRGKILSADKNLLELAEKIRGDLDAQKIIANLKK